MTSEKEIEATTRAIRAACIAADITPECNYPACACDQLPISIRAALSAAASARQEGKSIACKTAAELRSLAREIERVGSSNPSFSVVCGAVRECADHISAVARVHELQAQPATEQEVEPPTEQDDLRGRLAEALKQLGLVSANLGRAESELAALRTKPALPNDALAGALVLCDDCPPTDYPTDKTRCLPCPRRSDNALTVALDTKLRLFLAVLEKAGGESDASDDPRSWLNYFCDATAKQDTFNHAIELGYTRTTHDSNTDDSIVHLTDKGRAFLRSASPAAPEGWQPQQITRDMISAGLNAPTEGDEHSYVCDYITVPKRNDPDWQAISSDPDADDYEYNDTEWRWHIVKRILEAALATAPSPPQVGVDRWQPIETAPKNGRQKILLWSEAWDMTHGVVIARWGGERDGWICPEFITADWPSDDQPTHWHPIPDPPRAALASPPAGEGKS